ncbi:MAG: DUF2220 family protein [Rhodoferax sp.]|nr:DUF2220 family protein [Rhodoferax sp.]
MTWTTRADLRLQVQKLWDKGDLLRPCVQGQAVPPLRLRLVGPSSTELTERFDEVRMWMKALGCNAQQSEAPRYRIVMREFRHRVLGSNSVPAEIWLDVLDDALAMIGKQDDCMRFARLVQLTREQHPVLLPWLEKRPLNALALAQAWPGLLAVVAWLQAHPRPGIYLRQVGVSGVDSKFIEAHRGVLSELLDLALPAEAVDTNASGASQFSRRYGFRDKPLRVRFRLLDSSIARGTTGLFPADAELDITLTQAVFSQLELPVNRVFFTENEVNFLAFPSVRGSMVVFGAGYGFDVLAGAAWLQQCSIHYWGDIDTHGFAILDQLRAQLPHVQSLLMDRQTLMAHRDHWGEEPLPVVRDLPRLNAAESALFDDLRHKRLLYTPGIGLRLEQERIDFDSVLRAIAALPPLVS